MMSLADDILIFVHRFRMNRKRSKIYFDQFSLWNRQENEALHKISLSKLSTTLVTLSLISSTVSFVKQVAPYIVMWMYVNSVLDQFSTNQNHTKKGIHQNFLCSIVWLYVCMRKVILTLWQPVWRGQLLQNHQTSLVSAVAT